MAYVSHICGEERIYDFFYDPSYIVPCKEDAIKASQLARSISAPLKILPNFNEIFTDLPINERQTQFPTKLMYSTESIKNKLKSKQNRKYSKQLNLPPEKTKCTPLQQVDNIILDGRNINSFENLPKHKTVGSQTIYRESSAQTKKYEPDIANPFEEVENLEIYKLREFIKGEHSPDKLDIEAVQRARQRRVYNKFLSDINNIGVKLKKMKYMEVFEWEEWLARERLINDCQKMRMLIVCQMFSKRDAEFRETNIRKMTQKVNDINAVRKNLLNKNDMDYKRKLRKLKNKFLDKQLKYKRENITQEHIDYSSNLYGPQMRYGSNARTHFVALRKGFEVRMDALDATVNEEIHENRRNKWLNVMSKPKMSKQDYVKAFEDEKKIQVMYESLRSISLEVEEILRPKFPKCLKERYQYKKTEIIEIKKKTVKHDPCEMYKKGLKENIEILEDIDVEDSSDDLMDSIIRSQLDTLKQQVNYTHVKKSQKDFDDIIGAYQGKQIGWMLDFLNKELKRLKELENLQAFCLLAQCERIQIENAELKQREFENDQRFQNERAFNQLKNVKSQIASIYFENVLKQNIDFTAEKGATELATALPINFHVCSLINNEFLHVDILNLLERNQIKCEKDHFNKSMKNDVYSFMKEIFSKPTKEENNFELMDTIFTDVLKNVIPSDDEISEINSLDNIDDGEYEAKMAVKKVLRSIFPKNQWRYKTTARKVVEDIINDLIDDIDNDNNLYQLFKELVRTADEDELKSRILEACSENYDLHKMEEDSDTYASMRESLDATYNRKVKKSSSSNSERLSLAASSSSFSLAAAQLDESGKDLKKSKCIKRKKLTNNKPQGKEFSSRLRK